MKTKFATLAALLLALAPIARTQVDDLTARRQELRRLYAATSDPAARLAILERLMAMQRPGGEGVDGGDPRDGFDGADGESDDSQEPTERIRGGRWFQEMTRELQGLENQGLARVLLRFLDQLDMKLDDVDDWTPDELATLYLAWLRMPAALRDSVDQLDRYPVDAEEPGFDTGEHEQGWVTLGSMAFASDRHWAAIAARIRELDPRAEVPKPASWSLERILFHELVHAYQLSVRFDPGNPSDEFLAREFPTRLAGWDSLRRNPPALQRDFWAAYLALGLPTRWHLDRHAVHSRAGNEYFAISLELARFDPGRLGASEAERAWLGENRALWSDPWNGQGDFATDLGPIFDRVEERIAADEGH